MDMVPAHLGAPTNTPCSHLPFALRSQTHYYSLLNSLSISLFLYPLPPSLRHHLLLQLEPTSIGCSCLVERRTGYIFSTLLQPDHCNMASGAIGKCLLLASPLKVEEETKVINEKQGIVSILLSEPTQAKIATSSLRRNLSADMSSGKWLAQNGLSSSMKKIASSEQLAISFEEKEYEADQDEEKPGQDDVWRSIQMKKAEVEKPACQLDTWSSILSQNAKEDSNSLPPYVHPLVKTSTSSSLSEKSLQICTESLGSETGSEGFSLYHPSEKNETEEDNEEEEEVQQKEAQIEKNSDSCDRVEWHAVKCMYSTKSTTPRSFPPPLPSLVQSVGSTLHMQSHRLDGRLVLEAVSVSSQNCFHAQRQDGRLVLQLHDNQNLSETNDEDATDLLEDRVDDIDIDEDFESEIEEEQEDEMDEEIEEEQEDEMDEEMVRQEPIAVPRSTILFKKIMRIDNKSPAWPKNRFNKEEIEVQSEEEEEEELAPMPQSLPPLARLIRSPAVAAGSFNAYDYFWRTKPTMINPINQQSPAQKYSNNMTILPNSSKADKQQEPVFLRGNNAEYLVPLVRGCNDSKRSLQICEPFCVATS